jgi:predicted permease
MWRRRHALKQLDEDIRDHIERETEQNVERGMSPEAARRQALLTFGNPVLAKEDTRAVWAWLWLEQLVRDAQYALRTMRRSPGFAAAAVLTLGVGIGGTTAVFSVVDVLFLRAPEGVTEPDQVRRMFVGRNAGAMQSPTGTGGMWPDSATVKVGSHAFASVAAYQRPRLVDLGRGESAARVRASVVSGDFFGVLRVRPERGRLLGADDDGGPGALPVAVVSHAFWQNRLGGTDDALGKAVLVNGRPIQVVGVTQRGFQGIDADAVDVWVPASVAVYGGLQAEESWRSGDSIDAQTRHIARLHSRDDEGRAASEASAALARAADGNAALDPTPEVLLRPMVLAAVPGRAWAVDLSLWLLIAAGLVLVISCANVAHLLLVRGVTRQREIAMRLSLGASGWRVARQQLTESAVLALLGGMTGLVAAYLGMALLKQFPLPTAAGHLDGRVLAFSLVLSLFTALAFGVLPALRSIQIDPVRVLKGAHASGAPTSNRTRLALVVLQVSLSFALLVGAALFVRSLGQVFAIRGGVDLNRLLTVQVNFSGETAARSKMYDDFFEQALSRLSAVPGVERAAIVNTPPFEGWGWSVFWRRPGEEKFAKTITYLNLVGPGYFETAGTRLIRGREIQPSDRFGTEPVAVINDAMARLLTDDGNVLGLCVPIMAPRIAKVPCVQVVGVVESQRNSYLSPEAVPMIFRAFAQVPEGIPFNAPMLLVRTPGNSGTHALAVRAALQGLRPDLPYVSVAPLAERLRPALQPVQLGATLFSLFGLLAVFLSAVGLHAVLGYFVAERTAEVGIRRALGAPATAVVWLVVRQSLVPVVLGLAIGLGAALVGGRGLRAQLFGIGPHDATSILGAALCLIVIAAVATLLPVWRAIRIDPLLALRLD